MEHYDYDLHQEIYDRENDSVFSKFLEDYFFENYKKGKGAIELIFSPKCNLNCKYCYVKKYYHETFPSDMFDADKSIENALYICNWMVKHHYTPHVDIFSGELLAQEKGYELLEKMIQFYSTIEPEDRIPTIMIPTNFTFLNSENETAKVEKIISDFKDLGIKLFLSASFDGKFMEENRPYGSDLGLDLNQFRDDAYYDKVFEFCKKYNYGIHPMVYSKNIDKWIQNFEWFQENLEKHDMHWSQLYLLQVRNKEWTREEDKQFYDFIKYLIKWTWNKVGQDKEEYYRFLLKENSGYYSPGFNILRLPLVQNNRGYTCGIQSYLTIRLADMSMYPCHRLLYKDLKIGEFCKRDEYELDFKANNISLGLGIYGGGYKMNPVCVRCPMNELCAGGCLGSQYEVNKSMLAPIPTVCLNYLYYFKAIQEGFDEIGMTDYLHSYLKEEIYQQLINLREININDL